MATVKPGAGMEGQRKANRAAQEADWLRRLREDIDRVRNGGPNRPPTGSPPSPTQMGPNTPNYSAEQLLNSPRMQRFAALEAGTGLGDLSNADLQNWLRTSGASKAYDLYLSGNVPESDVVGGGKMDPRDPRYQSYVAAGRPEYGMPAGWHNWSPQGLENYWQQHSGPSGPFPQSSARPALDWMVPALDQYHPGWRDIHQRVFGNQGPGGASPTPAPAPQPGNFMATLDQQLAGLNRPAVQPRDPSMGAANAYNGPTGVTSINRAANDPYRDWGDHGSSQQLREAQLAYSGDEAHKKFIQRQLAGTDPRSRRGRAPIVDPATAARNQQYSLQDIYTQNVEPWRLGGRSTGLPTQATVGQIPAGALERFQQLYGGAPSATGMGAPPTNPQQGMQYWSQRAARGY